MTNKMQAAVEAEESGEQLMLMISIPKRQKRYCVK